MSDLVDIPEPLATQVTNAYLAQLTNRDLSQPLMLVTFSGTPGCGKTTLANHLAADLHAQCLQSDALREMIRSFGSDPAQISMPSLSDRIIQEVIKHDRNQLFIIDASMDRVWQFYLKHVKRLGALSFIIRFDMPPVVIRRRMSQRNRHDDQDLLAQFDTFWQQFEDCRRNLPADITLGEAYDYDDVLERVRAAVAKAPTLQSKQ
ncbi:MAG TPA: ATP-binding protein [Patescibacteria group bacterium]|nr:ATP-binding protein [Patescibacteria group bacterium]